MHNKLVERLSNQADDKYGWLSDAQEQSPWYDGYSVQLAGGGSIDVDHAVSEVLSGVHDHLEAELANIHPSLQAGVIHVMGLL